MGLGKIREDNDVLDSLHFLNNRRKYTVTNSELQIQIDPLEGTASAFVIAEDQINGLILKYDKLNLNLFIEEKVKDEHAAWALMVITLVIGGVVLILLVILIRKIYLFISSSREQPH